MQDPLFCGIGRQLGGETVVDAITDYGGFFILSKSSQYTDPFSKPQKARQNTEGDISSTFFAMFDGERGDCSEYPMVFVSQSEAKEFCQWLGPRYRLPTWQEWSWAAKGGEEYNFGTSNGNIISNPDEVTTGTDPVYLANIQGEYSNTPLTKRIKSYGANKYGLYDMTGNVSEWTYFIAEDETEGATLPSEFRHIMGGNFSTRSYAASTTWARYGVGSEGLWGSDIGFRVVYDVTRASSFAQSIDPIP
jgi:formylglycine-generating enzyme required for sulfatase activity